nr:unnamed protein product [Callosobruchus analis]
MAENWKLWRARFENYLVASEVNKKDEKTQVAQLLHYIGDEGFQIFTSFKLEDDRDKLAPVLRKFDEHFLGKENVAYERYQFFTYRQSEGQSTDDYIVQLKNKARRCKLEGLQDSLIVTMLTCGVRNHKVRERLLQDDNLSLDKAVELCQVMESATARSHMMGQRTQAVPGYSSVETVYNRSKSTNNKREGKEIKCFLELDDQSDESVIQTEHSVQQDSDSEYESVSNSVDNIPLESLKNTNVKNLTCERVLKPGSEEAFVLKEKVTSHGRISRPPRRLSY